MSTFLLDGRPMDYDLDARSLNFHPLSESLFTALDIYSERERSIQREILRVARSLLFLFSRCTMRGLVRESRNIIFLSFTFNKILLFLKINWNFDRKTARGTYPLLIDFVCAVRKDFFVRIIFYSVININILRPTIDETRKTRDIASKVDRC